MSVTQTALNEADATLERLWQSQMVVESKEARLVTCNEISRVYNEEYLPAYRLLYQGDPTNTSTFPVTPRLGLYMKACERIEELEAEGIGAPEERAQAA